MYHFEEDFEKTFSQGEHIMYFRLGEIISNKLLVRVDREKNELKVNINDY